MDNLPSRAEMRRMMRIRPALVKGRRRALEEENERYNPISPANGNTVIRGGAMAMSSRTPRLSMADKRALEIQQRHETPGTGGVPSSGVSQMRGGGLYGENGHGLRRMVGGSATPSMGVSMFRGGDLSELLSQTNVAQSGRTEGQGRLRQKSMPPLEMRGGKHHRDGQALSEHLLSTLGKAKHKKLLEGLLLHGHGIHGGGWFGDLMGKIKNEFVNPESKLRGEIVPKVTREFTDPRSKLRGEILPKAAQGLQLAAPVLDVAGAYVGLPGAGQMLSRGAQGLQRLNQGAAALGYGKRRRAPASAGDGRRIRADIVRKVMKERGLSMIEASKAVKAEGLY